MRTAIIVGGVHMQEQKHDLRTGVEIVVATPGRFIDHLQQVGLARVSPPCSESGPGYLRCCSLVWVTGVCLGLCARGFGMGAEQPYSSFGLYRWHQDCAQIRHLRGWARGRD